MEVFKPLAQKIPYCRVKVDSNAKGLFEMRINMKKMLLLANIALIGIICFSAVATVNYKTKQIERQRMTSICKHVIQQVNAGTMSLEAAGLYAAEKARVGDYIPMVTVFQKQKGLFLETNQPTMSAGLFGGKSDGVDLVNCTALAAT